MKRKPLIGALVGAGLGAVLWFWLVNRGTLVETSWIPILVGPLAGVGARLFSEPMARAWQRGGVVAAIALAATYATQQGTTSVLEDEFRMASFSISDLLAPVGPDVGAKPQQKLPDPSEWEAPPFDLPAPVANPPALASDRPAESPDTPDRPTFEFGAARDSPSPDEAPVAEAVADGVPHETASLPDGPSPDADTPSQQQTPPAANADVTQDSPLDQSMLVPLCYLVGTLAAYVLGRGPEPRPVAEEAEGTA